MVVPSWYTGKLGSERSNTTSQKGISRSGVVVMAYLMRRKNMNFSDVATFVAGKRPIVCPNLGFLKQLQLYEQMKYDLEGDTPAHAEYKQLRMKSYLTDELVRWRGRALVTFFSECFQMTPQK